jgi:hypothetical protein
MRPPINSSVKSYEKNCDEESPMLTKGSGTFSFWGGFEARIQSIGNLPDPRRIMLVFPNFP